MRREDSLRDSFALAALPVLPEDALLNATDADIDNYLTDATLKAYIIADAMLAARNADLDGISR